MEKEIYTAVLADCEVTFKEVPELLKISLESEKQWLEIEDIDTDEVILLNKNRVIYIVKVSGDKEE